MAENHIHCYLKNAEEREEGWHTLWHDFRHVPITFLKRPKSRDTTVWFEKVAIHI